MSLDILEELAAQKDGQANFVPSSHFKIDNKYILALLIPG